MKMRIARVLDPVSTQVASCGVERRSKSSKVATRLHALKRSQMHKLSNVVIALSLALGKRARRNAIPRK